MIVHHSVGALLLFLGLAGCGQGRRMSNANDRIVIPLSKFKVVLITVGALLFVATGVGL
jgi:hypothetical protein